MKKKIAAIVLAALTAVSSLGALSVPAAADEAEGDKLIVYSFPEMYSTFWKAVYYGFENKAKELGYKPMVLDANGDPEEQVNQIRNAVTQGAVAICCSAIEMDTITPTIEEVDAQGIPFFCVDRACEGPVTSTLATDNFAAGAAIGEQMIKDYGEEFSVLIMRSDLSNIPSIERGDGILSVLEQHEGVTIVGDVCAGEFTAEAAMATAKNYLGANDIDCIFTVSDSLVKGTYAACVEAGFDGVKGEDNHIGIYSVDGEGWMCDMIRDGQTDATFSQLPITFGEDVVARIDDYYNGVEIEDNYVYMGDVVTQDNVDDLKDSLWGYVVQ